MSRSDASDASETDSTATLLVRDFGSAAHLVERTRMRLRNLNRTREPLDDVPVRARALETFIALGRGRCRNRRGCIASAPRPRPLAAAKRSATTFALGTGLR